MFGFTPSLFWVQQNQVPLSNKTMLEYHRLISSILALADKEMLIPYNPAAKTTPPKAKRQRVEYYQPDEMETIIAALDNVPIRWKAITHLLIDTGCRSAEIMGLKWDNLDMDEGIVMIDCALLYTKSKGIYEGDTKTGEVRAMRIAPETIAVLQQWRERYLDLKEDNGDRWVDTPYVFVRDNGSAMHPDSITRWLHEFGLKIGFPNLHPHAFRHTAASTMIANGVSGHDRSRAWPCQCHHNGNDLRPSDRKSQSRSSQYPRRCVCFQAEINMQLITVHIVYN